MMTAAVRQALGLSKPRAKPRPLNAEDFLPSVRAMANSLARTVKMLPEDLFGYGCLGLTQALQRYDVTWKVPFHLYMRRRVIGAMWDGVREWAWFSRKTHDQFFMGPLEDCQGEAYDDSLYSSLETGLLLGRTRDWPERDRKVLALVLEGYSQVEIARVIGVSESRVSQIFKQLLHKSQKLMGVYHDPGSD